MSVGHVYGIRSIVSHGQMLGRSTSARVVRGEEIQHTENSRHGSSQWLHEVRTQTFCYVLRSILPLV